MMKVKYQKITSKKSIYILVLLIVLIAVSLWVMNSLTKTESATGLITEAVNADEGWKTYTNEEYGFKIDFPKDWRIAEDFERTSPIINIYKPKFDKKPPFDHFSDVNAISIFPRGVETEALIGETVDSEIAISASVDIDEVVDYVLKNGDVWARYITFDTVEEPWKSWGSVWARAEIKNLEFSCENGSEIVPIEK